MNTLSEAELGALNDALDDEYKALATYDQVVEDFGPVRPFINIRDAEARHIDALHRLYDAYGVTAPPNPYIGAVERFDSVESACKAAVQGEIDNSGLYKRLLKQTQRPDIIRVFENLRDASAERHLPAFQRCAARYSR